MFLKSLCISNSRGVIRDIAFRSGINLIVDETPPSDSKQETGNNVGKTSVLMLIDFCLGGDGKGIYTDAESKKNEYLLVKNFLIDTAVIAKLILTADLDDPNAEELVIERNFLPHTHKQMVRRTNGQQQKSEEEFLATLTEQLIPGHGDRKPSFRQIISHNIRYKEQNLTNTLNTLDKYTRDDEYETLHLFMLGCDFKQGRTRQNLLARIRLEKAIRKRLESKQTRSAYESALALISSQIDELDKKKSAFYIAPDFESDLQAREEIEFRMNALETRKSFLKFRYDLIKESVADIRKGYSEIDMLQLKTLYSEVSNHLTDMQKSFEDLVTFHNRMVDEKARYIAKELPALAQNLAEMDAELKQLQAEKKVLVSKINQNASIGKLEDIIRELNEKHRLKGVYQAAMQEISESEDNLNKLEKSLAEIDKGLFSGDFETLIQAQINKLNRYFSAISQELYGEEYALKKDRIITRSGQRVYKFTTFNTNISSGKKQGEISCFDIAYTLFADEEQIPCYHFLLNDKKELMHGNQLAKIAALVDREHRHVQFVASILKDKLPPELNQEEYFVLKLSQDDKLFRIEGQSSNPSI